MAHFMWETSKIFMAGWLTIYFFFILLSMFAIWKWGQFCKKSRAQCVFQGR